MPILSSATRGGRGMKTTFAFVKPDEMQVAMTITMPLGEWRELRKLLPETWPAYELRRHILDVVQQAEKVFHASTPDA